MTDRGRNVVRTLVLVLLVGFALGIIGLTRHRDRLDQEKNRREQITQDLLNEMDRLESEGDLEAQTRALMADFHARTRDPSLPPSEFERAYQEVFRPFLPPHDLFLLGPKPAGSSVASGGGHPPSMARAAVRFQKLNPLGFDAVIGTYSVYLDSFTVFGNDGRVSTSLSPDQLMELASRTREAVGGAFPLEPSQQVRMDFIEFRSSDRRLFLAWEEFEDKAKIILLMDGGKLSASFLPWLMARRWGHPRIALGIWDSRRERLLGSAMLRSHPALAAAVAQLARGSDPQKRVEAEAAGFLICAGPPLPGNRFRPFLARSLEGQDPAGAAIDFWFFVITTGLFCLTVWAAVEGFLFSRRPGFSVRAVMIFSLVLVSILPLAGTGYYIRQLAGEWIGRQRDLLSNDLAEDLRQIDAGFDATVASYTHQLRIWARSPSVREELARALAAHDKERMRAIFVKVVQDFTGPEILKMAAVVGPEEFFHSWRMVGPNLFEPPPGDMSTALFRTLLERHLFELNPSLKTTLQPGQDQGPKLSKAEFIAEQTQQFFVNMAGPEGYLTLTYFPQRLARFESRSQWLGFFDVPVLIEGKVQFILRWYFSSQELEYQYLRSRVVAPPADAPEATLFLAVSRPRDPRFSVIPESLPLASHTRLLGFAHQVYKTQVNVRFREFDLDHPRLVDVQFPRNLRFILVGAKPTTGLERTIRESHAAGNLVVAGFLCLAMVIGLLTAAYFIEPLRQLGEGVEQVSQGNLGHRLSWQRGDEFDSLADTFNRMARGLEEGKILGRFVSTSVRKMVDAGETTTAAARRCRVTVLFSRILVGPGIRQDPGQFFHCLNAHLRALEVALISAGGGEIDKIIGDKILVVFHHEEFGGDAAAVDAALEVARRVGENLRAGGLIERIVMGLNTGEVVAGVLGSGNVRLDHTVIGDPVNLAARLAELARAEGITSGMVAAAETVRLSRRRLRSERLAQTRVKGKTQQIEAFQIWV